MEESCLAEEIEVLEAIYIHELDVERNDREDVEKIVLQLHPATGDDVELQFVCMTLILELPNTYPEEPPDIAIRNPRGIGEEEVQSLLEDMHLRSQERTGGAMLFELIELAKDSLTSGNIPHCACMICLEHFTEGDSFTKTECYHYFHQSCLSRYIKHALSDDSKIEASYARHTKVEEKKLLCPVCREEIRDRSDELFETEDSESFHFTPSAELLKMQASMADMLAKQKVKGGIIDVEAEKNKFLVKKDDVVHLTSAASDPNLHGKDVKADLRPTKENTDRPRSGNESRYKQTGKGKSERYDKTKDRPRTGYDREKERPQSGYVRGKGRGRRFDERYHSDDDVRTRGRYNDEKRDRKFQEDWRSNNKKYSESDKKKYSDNDEKKYSDNDKKKKSESDKYKQDKSSFYRDKVKSETKAKVDEAETDSKVKSNVCDESSVHETADQRIEECKVEDEGEEKDIDSRQKNSDLKQNDDLKQKEASNSGKDKKMKDRYSNEKDRRDDRQRFRRDDWRDRNNSNRPESRQSDRRYYKNDNRDNRYRDGNYRAYRDDTEQSDRQYRRQDNRNNYHRDRNYNPKNDRVVGNNPKNDRVGGTNPKNDRGEGKASPNKCDTRTEPKQSYKESKVIRSTEVKSSQDHHVVNGKIDERISDRKKNAMESTNEHSKAKDLVKKNDDDGMFDNLNKATSDNNYRDGSGRRSARGRGRAKPRSREINEPGFNERAMNRSSDTENKCDRVTKGVQDLHVTDQSDTSCKVVGKSDSCVGQEEKTSKTGQSKGPPGFKMRPPPGFGNSSLSNAVTAPPPGF